VTNRNQSAGGCAELRSKRRGLDAKLLRGIHRHKAVCATQSAKTRQRSARALRQWSVAGNAEVGADAIDGEIVGVGALAIHAELALVVERGGGHDHTGREQDQGLETPAIEKKIADERMANHGADRWGLGIQQRGAGFDRTVSDAEPSVISKSISIASWTCRATSGWINFLKLSFDGSFRHNAHILPVAQALLPVRVSLRRFDFAMR
jgi:hypothetical protein